MDAFQVNFMPGDKVRRTNGETFSNGMREATVDKVVGKDNEVQIWLVETKTYVSGHEGYIELVKAAPSIRATTCPTPDDTSSEGYPDGNPKTRIGLTKPPLHVIPTAALIHLGQAMKDGAAKYGLMNWREHNVSSSVYYDAAMRHLMSWWDGEEVAQDSGVHHLAHAMACLAIILDAQENHKLNDNRPIPGNAAELIARLTKAAA